MAECEVLNSFVEELTSGGIDFDSQPHMFLNSGGTLVFSGPFLQATIYMLRNGLNAHKPSCSVCGHDWLWHLEPFSPKLRPALQDQPHRCHKRECCTHSVGLWDTGCNCTGYCAAILAGEAVVKSKRETCKWARVFDHQNKASVCECPLPPCYQQDRLVVGDECCDICPCHEPKKEEADRV